MNTPTPRTDAATYPADCLGKTLVTNRDCSRALERELVTLTGAYTCTHHNDQQRASCPVCIVTALTAERDQLRSDCENETKWAAHYLAQSIADKARAERAEAIVGKLQELHGCSQEMVVHWCEHAANRSLGLDQARSQLATEREKVRVLREALENLRDEQNGAPLCTREEQWKQAMDGADAALAATEAKP
jgi:hypothetical protein